MFFACWDIFIQWFTTSYFAAGANCFIIFRMLRERRLLFMWSNGIIVFVPQIKHLNYSLSTGHSRRDWKTTEKMMDLLSPFELSVEKYASHFLPWGQQFFSFWFSFIYSQTFSDVCWRSRIIIFIIWLFWLTDVRLFERLLTHFTVTTFRSVWHWWLQVHWANKK